MKSLLAYDQQIWYPGSLSTYKNWPGHFNHFDESLNETSFSFTHGKQFFLAPLWATKYYFILQPAEEKMLELSINILPATWTLPSILQLQWK